MRIRVRSLWAGKYSHTKYGYTSNILQAVWWWISFSVIEAIRVIRLNRYHRRSEVLLIPFCYQDCKHLSIQEKDQKFYEPHFCKLYGKTVYHGVYHPELVRLNECRYRR